MAASDIFDGTLAADALAILTADSLTTLTPLTADDLAPLTPFTAADLAAGGRGATTLLFFTGGVAKVDVESLLNFAGVA